MDVVVAQLPEIGPFRDVLPDEFVGVLDRSLLPRGVAVGEVHGGLQRLGYLPVAAELHAVVRGYRQHVPPVRPEQPGDRFRHGVGLAALRQTLHDEVVPAPLAQGQYRTLLSLSHYQVHLPVAEPPPVRLRRPAMDAYPAGYVRDPRRTATLPVPPVLHLVTAMAPQLSAAVLPDHLVDPFMRYRHSLPLQPARYLLRRPVLAHQQPPRLSQHLCGRLPVPSTPLPPLLRPLVGYAPPVPPLAVAVPPHLPAYCAPVDSYLPGNGRLRPSLLYSQIDCVSLLPGQLVIHDNTKLIDPRGTPVPLFILCCACPPKKKGNNFETVNSEVRRILAVALRC